MLWGGPEPEGLEVRRDSSGGVRVSGVFPYNKMAVLSDGGKTGRPRKERFSPGAFAHSVESELQEIYLLSGHEFAKPLASKGSGTLRLTDTPAALEFEANITADIARTSYARDALVLLEAGLAVGVSPGFRIPPARTVPNAETIEAEPPEQGTAIIRTINDAILYELSIVTRPAYQEASAQVEARSWEPTGTPVQLMPLTNVSRRWRL